MFSLFATEKKPHGPSLSRLENINIELSGNHLSLELPYGNEKNLPAPNGTVVNSFNIYDSERYIEETNATYLVKPLLKRSYSYRSFMQGGLGTLMVDMIVHQINDPEENLFEIKKLKDVLKDNLSTLHTEFNDGAGEDCKIFPPDKYEKKTINNLEWLRYSFKEHSLNNNYTVALTQNHYITFYFSYLTWDETLPWYLMAKELENKIMASVHLELGESLEKEKRLAQG